MDFLIKIHCFLLLKSASLMECFYYGMWVKSFWTGCMELQLAMINLCSLRCCQVNLVWFFFCDASAQLECMPPYCWGFHITHTHTHLVGLLWTCAQLITEATAYTTQQTPGMNIMPSVGFEPSVPAIERPQTCASDCTATRIGLLWISVVVSLQQDVVFLCS